MWGATSTIASILLISGMAILLPETTYSQSPSQTELPKGVVKRLNSGRFLHPAPIRAIACFPDGSAFVTAGGNVPVHLWSAETGELEATFPVRWATSFAFFAGGSKLAIGDAFGTVAIFTITDRSDVRRVEFSSPIAAIHPVAGDDTLLVATENGELYRLGDDGQKVKLTASDASLAELAVDRGNTLAVLACRTTKLLAVSLMQANSTILCEAPVPVASAAVTSDAIIGGGNNGEVFIWSRKGGKPKRKWLAHNGPITALMLIADASLLTTDERGNVTRWDIRTGKRTATVKLPVRDCQSITVTSDGKRIVTGGDSGRLHVLDAATLEAALPPPLGRPCSLAVTKDGATTLVAYESGKIVRYRADTGEIIDSRDTKRQSPVAIALYKSGKGLAVVEDRLARLYDLKKGSEVDTVDWGRPVRFRCHAADALGTTLAVADSNGTVWIISLVEKRLVRKLGAGVPVLAVAVAPGGKKVAVCSYEGTWLWDVASGRRLLRLKTKQPCRCVAFSPHGQLVSIGHLDGTITIWDVQGRLQQTCAFHESAVTTLAFSTCSQLLVSGSMAGKVAVWEIASAEPIFFREAHTGPVTHVNSGGMFAFSAGADGAVFVWRLSGELEQALPLAASQMEGAWRDLAGDVEAGQIAAWRLLATGPVGLAMLDKKLNLPPRNKVRAWIELLDHERFAVREKAAVNLHAVGPWVQSRLLEILNDPPSLEVEVRIANILERLHRSGSLTARQQKLLLKRVLQILARDNSATARSLLKRIAESAVAESIVKEAAALLRQS